MRAEQLRSVKSCFDTPGIYEVYAHCMYLPTWEKFCERAKIYMADEWIGLYAYEEGPRTAGVVAVRRQPDETAEILGIAVSPDFRGRGIGRGLLDFVLHTLSCKGLSAETDDDAVEFYRKYGFETSMFLKDGEYRRYRCNYRSGSGEDKRFESVKGKRR